MFAKLSLKSVVRTPGKTLLFLLLLSGGIAFLCLGVGMWVSAQNLLADADKNYSTVAYIEYIGENYPDANQLDDFMVEELSSYDPTPLFNQPGVLSCDRQTVLGATVETLFPGTRSTRLFINTGVLRFKVYYVKEEAIVCMIMGQPLFAGEKYYDGVFFNLSYTELADMGIDAARLERGKQFMANGSFYVGENRSLWFRIEPCLLNVPDSYREFAACPFFVIEDPNDYTDTLPYEMLYKMAETYKTLSSQLRICASDYPEEDLPFYLEETALVAGDFYAPGQENVCLVSEYILQEMGLSIGDTLELNLYAATTGRSAETSYWCDDGYLAAKSYTVAGAFKNSTGMYATIYIPKGDASWMPAYSVDYTVCRVKLQNSAAEAYVEAIQPYLLGSMRVTVYDQGYAHARDAIDSLKDTAVLLSVVCGLCTLALLVLFGWLFLLKQRLTARIMMNLGTGRRKTLGYLLLSALLVLALSSLLGGIAGGVLSRKVTVAAYEKALAGSLGDYRFSSMATQGTAKEYSTLPESDPLSAVLTALCAGAAGMVFSALFSLLTISAFTPRKPKRQRKKKEKQSPRLPNGAVAAVSFGREALPVLPKKAGPRLLFPFKIAGRAIARNGGKSLLVVLVAFGLTVFLGIFCGDLNKYRQQLDTVYNRIPVTAYMTTFTGKTLDGMSLTRADILPISRLGFIKETYYTQKVNYQFNGVVNKADGTAAADVPYSVIPSNSFAAETFIESFLCEPNLIGTNHISTVPEYYFSGDVEIEYLEGYGESLFTGAEKVCLLNSGFMKEKGIALGDTVRLTAGADQGDNDLKLYYLDLKVVGICPSLSGRDTVYCPLALLEEGYLKVNYEVIYKDIAGYNRLKYQYEKELEKGLVTGSFEENCNTFMEDGVEYILGPDGTCYYACRYDQRYQSVSFLLQHTAYLTSFKQALSDIGYTPVGQVGRNRRTLVISERTLEETVDSLNRHISYMNALFGAIYALTVGIGLAVSYLLTKSRRPEFAMMRSMGSGKGRALLTFSLEQGGLFLIGGLLGFILLVLTNNVYALTCRALGVFTLCYLGGVLLAAGLMNRLNVLETLSVKE